MYVYGEQKSTTAYSGRGFCRHSLLIPYFCRENPIGRALCKFFFLTNL